MAAIEKIDWSECPLVEVKPGVQSGAPVLRGTRMPVDAIADNFDYGVSAVEIAEQFEIPPERVEAILTYDQSHRFPHPVWLELKCRSQRNREGVAIEWVPRSRLRQ
jgi:uncharacterized protein (DUF433 family)